MIKKMLLSVDIEGISNVNKRSWLNQKDKETYHKMCIEMTKDTNVAIEESINAGFQPYVVDAHSKGKNLLKDLLDKRAIKLEKNELVMMSHIDEDFAGVIFIGYHGMAGTNTFCAHTNSTALVKKVIINQKEMSEGMTNAVIAKHFNVPVFYISGTDQGIKEMKEFMPDLIGTVVLNSIDFENCTTTPNSRELMRKDVSKALKTNGQTCNFPTTNLEWDVTFNSNRNVKFTTDIHEGSIKYREEMNKEKTN